MRTSRLRARVTATDPLFNRRGRKIKIEVNAFQMKLMVGDRLMTIDDTVEWYQYNVRLKVASFQSWLADQCGIPGRHRGRQEGQVKDPPVQEAAPIRVGRSRGDGRLRRGQALL